MARSQHWRSRAGFTGLVAIGIAVGTMTLAVSAAARPGTAATTSSAGRTAPAVIAMPTVAAAHRTAALRAPSARFEDLQYNGGTPTSVGTIGVTTGHERVYLVFWGSQWGSIGNDGHGDVTLSGDPSQIAPLLQLMYRGFGTGGDRWSGVLTQYCQDVPTGSKSCPAFAPRVAYPTGGTLAGVWVDEHAAAPSSTNESKDQAIFTEAFAAARHFGQTSGTQNRNAQYVVVSPTGTHPDGFLTTGNFCAWHSAAPSSAGDLAFTNMPYVPDASFSCGAGIVNGLGSGDNDGVTIVAGHEYAETVTDQEPTSGWFDPADTTGGENGDKCAWVTAGDGHPGDSVGNVTFGTGTFPMQPTWSNDSGNCRISHPIVPSCAVRQLLGNPGFEAARPAPWSASRGVIVSTSNRRSGSKAARLGGHGRISSDFLQQSVSQAGNCNSDALSFWLHVVTADHGTRVHDTLTVAILDAHGRLLRTLRTFSNRNATRGYVKYSFHLSGMAGRHFTLRFTSHENNGLATTFYLDDTALWT